MFRICRAEFKKLFLKPSIFVLAGILIFVLASCSFLYKPNDRPNSYVPLLGETTISGYYNKLDRTDGILTESFINYENKIKNAKTYISYYETEFDAKAELKRQLDEDFMTAYRNYGIAYTNYLNNDVESNRTSLINARQAFYNIIFNSESSIKASYEIYRNVSNDNQKMNFLTTKSLDNNIDNLFQDCSKIFKDAQTKNGEDEIAIYKEIKNNIDNINFKAKLESYFDELIAFIPNAEYVNSLKDYITETENRLGLILDETNVYSHSDTEGLYKEIADFVNSTKGIPAENNDKANLTKLQKMVTQYKQSCENLLNLVTNGIKLDGLKQYENMELTKFTGLDNFNYYEQKEEQVKLLYLFKTNTFEFDYATPFSMDQPSNYNVNAFDFSYFALRLCMFIIVIYVITVAASTITGEQSNGTLKMLAIRPYNRSKLLAGKLLSTLLIGTLLIAVSAVATLAVGGISYGFASNPVLVVFNASSASAMSPVLLYFIYLLTLIVEMAFFVLLALAISMLFKSQIASVAISILVYFGTIVLNMLLGTASWLKILPFTNINLYKYLGSSFLSHDTNFLRAMFSSPVAVGSSFWLSFVYTAVVMIGLTVTVFEVFKRRDIR